MIWIQENKGLAAFLGLCLVGCAALGFMLFGSYNGYTTAYAEYDNTRKQVDTLEHKALFPDEESIKLKKDDVDAYANEVSELRAKLVKFQPTLNFDLTGNQFQGRLTERVERIHELATRKNVALPEGFRLDFDRWIGQPAPQNAVAKLDFQLEAISDLVTTAIGSGISGVISVTRGELAEERGETADSDGKSKKKSKKPSGGASVPALLERYPVEMTFRTPHSGFVNLINALSNASQTPNHFFIIRLLEVQNEASVGPLKEDSFAPEPIYSDAPDLLVPVEPAPTDPTLDPLSISPDPGVDPAPIDPLFPVDPALIAPAPTFGAGTPVAYRDTRVLLGEEELEVYLKVEIIRFKPETKAVGRPDEPGS